MMWIVILNQVWFYSLHDDVEGMFLSYSFFFIGSGPKKLPTRRQAG